MVNLPANLKSITLHECNISKFPMELLKLRKLEEIDISWDSFARITNIPKELCALKKLKVIKIPILDINSLDTCLFLKIDKDYILNPKK